MSEKNANGDEVLKVPINPVAFKRMCSAIENLEFEPAMLDLRALMGFSYGEEIDDHLKFILGSLERKQYMAARNEVFALRKTIRLLSSGVDCEKKRRILAVDDFPDILRRIKSGLKTKFDVVGVTNHMAALKFLTTHTADLILLDIEMPDMDGFTLLGIIRKLEDYKTTPVIFLTSNATPEYVRKACEHGGNDYIKKPVDLNLLTERILKLLPNE